jgi:penicillin amidase
MRRAIVIGLVIATASLFAPVDTASSKTSFPQLQGLERPARVVRDSNGIAHIFAKNDHDVFFLQGYVHASDRLFQMDLSRREASGTRAELLGPDFLNDDVETRTIGIRRAAERSQAVLSDEAEAVLQAYSDGVNAWVASHPLPPEYADIEVTHFEPWTPLDSGTLGLAIAFSLSFDIDIFRTLDYQGYLAAGEAGGFDGDALFRDVNRVQPFSDAATVPDATGSAAALGTSAPDAGNVAAATALPQYDPAVSEAARRYYDRVKDVDFFQRLRQRPNDTGSNEWGVAASHAEGRGSLMANDPHLSLNTPSTFYPIGLHSRDMDVVGSGFAGAPLVILGRNRDIAWGATTNPMDVTDSYEELVVDDPSSPSGLSTTFQGQLEHVVAIPEVFKANDPGNGTNDDVTVVPPGTDVGSDLGPLPDRTLIVPRRNNGPMLIRFGSLGLSIQFTGFSPVRLLDTFLIWNKAKNLDDFEEGLQYFDVGSQNWAYHDREGNLAYFTSAENPLREDLEAGAVNGAPPFFIRNGQGGNEWLPVTSPQPGQAVPYEILPAAEMPHVVNPPAGFFVNANNDPAGTTLDNDPLNQFRPTGGIYYLNPGYDGFRAGRITEAIREQLAADGKISFAEMQAIQADVKLIDAEVFVPHVTQALTNAQASATPELAALAADPQVTEAVRRFAGWDFSTPTGIPEGYDASDAHGVLSAPSPDEVTASIAATLYSVWRGQFLRSTVDSTLAPLGVSTPDADTALSLLRYQLENYDTTQGVGEAGLDFFGGGAVADAAERRDLLILRSVRTALDLLAGDAFAPAFSHSTNQVDYRWGLLHRIVFDHPLGGSRNVPPAGGFAPVLPNGLSGIATDGGFGTPDASGHNPRADAANEFMFGGGPVRRWVSAASRGRIDAQSSLPGGVSGDVTSPFYANLLPEWLTNESFEQSVRYSDVRRGAVSIIHYRP